MSENMANFTSSQEQMKSTTTGNAAEINQLFNSHWSPLRLHSPPHASSDNLAKSTNKGLKTITPQVEWVWNGDTNEESFIELLPDHPLDEEQLRNLDKTKSVLPEEVRIKAIEYAKTQIPPKFICTGPKGKKEEHEADEETFKETGMCKSCLYKEFGELKEKQSKKQSKKPPKKADETLLKIYAELEKLDTKEKEKLMGVLNENYIKTGIDLKDRLRGIGMGYHIENKGRKIQQFVHNSTLCYYAYGLKCLTLVYDEEKKKMLIIGAQEVQDELSETAEKIKENPKKTHLKAGISLMKKVFKNCPHGPPVTENIQKTASTVWNNAFSKRSVTEEQNIQTKKKKVDDQNASSLSSSQDAQMEVVENSEVNLEVIAGEILTGEIIDYDEQTGVLFTCNECGNKEMKKGSGDEFFCTSEKCSKVVEATEKAVVVVKVKLTSPVLMNGVLTKEVLIELEEYEVSAFLSKENPSPRDLIGGKVDPQLYQFNGTRWRKRSVTDES